MNLEASAVAGRDVTLSVGEVLALSLRSGIAAPLLRGLAHNVACWHAHRRQACPKEELQTALNHFRKQAGLTASEDFYAFLGRLGASLDEVLDVFRAGFYGRFAVDTEAVEPARHLMLSATQLLPMAAFVEGHWASFSKKAALMVAAYEAQEAGLGNAALPEGMSGDELRAATELLAVAPGRLELIGRICNCFQQLCARAVALPESEAERSIMAINLTQVATLEAHAASAELARELYLCAKHEGASLPELCRETGTVHEMCLHQVALLRARAGWQAVAFAAPGDVFYLGPWEDAYLVVHVLERRVPARDDWQLQRRVAEAVVEKRLVRERELVRVVVS